MDNENYRAITALARTENDKQKVRMLADYITTYKNANTIPDPYYGDERDFDYALDLIEDAVSELLKIYENEE
jgi:phosphotyrosine protein phosphatase